MDDDRLKDMRHFGQDYFDELNDREILEDSGKVSQTVAKEVALEEYEKFDQQRVEKQTNDDFEAFLGSRNFKK